MFSGEGPGPQTADGCSVELYRLSIYRGELEEMHALFKPGVTVLELGCGTGRMTRRLLELGCRVTGVDNSSAMLEAVPEEATRVAADIERLQLKSSFDVVVLASHLINHPDADLRHAFVQAASRHAIEGTHFLVETHDTEWLSTVSVGALGISEGIALHVDAVHRDDEIVSMTLRYQKGSSVWRQSFSTMTRDKKSVESVLIDGGFGSFTWFGQRGHWVDSVFQ